MSRNYRASRLARRNIRRKAQRQKANRRRQARSVLGEVVTNHRFMV